MATVRGGRTVRAMRANDSPAQSVKVEEHHEAVHCGGMCPACKMMKDADEAAKEPTEEVE